MSSSTKSSGPLKWYNRVGIYAITTTKQPYTLSFSVMDVYYDKAYYIGIKFVLILRQ